MDVPTVETKKQTDLFYLKLQSIFAYLERALDQKTLVAEVIKNLKLTMGAQQALFFLVKSKPSGLFMKPVNLDSSHKSNKFFLNRRDPLVRYLLNSKAPIFLQSNENDHLLDSLFFKSCVNTSVCQILLPLFYKNKIKGLLVFGEIDSELFIESPEIESLLQRIGNLLGQALQQRSLQRRILRIAKEKSVLLRIGQKISASLDLNKVLNTIIDSLKEVVPYDAAVIFLINEKTCEIEQEVSRGYNPDFIQKLHLKVGQGLSGWVAKTGQPILVPDVRKDKRYVVADPQTLSEIAVPLMRGKKIIGVFNVESKKVNAYTWQDVELLKTFASQATIAIENARLFKEALHKRYLEKELEVAREIQKALLPKRLPKVKRFAFAALNVPSEQVGGDFYDAIKLADGTVSLAIADVSGKGTPGAILMSNLSATFRSQVRRDLPPDVILERVNKLFCETITSGSFATFFYGKLNPRTKSLEYANAGHNPPLLIRSDGSMEFLKKGGLIMGFLPRVEYNREEVQLAPGDLLIMYTDGLTEAENKKGQLFGTERLIKVVKKHTKLPPTVVKRKIFQELKKFLKGSPLNDDVTLLLVKAV